MTDENNETADILRKVRELYAEHNVKLDPPRETGPFTIRVWWQYANDEPPYNVLERIEEVTGIPDTRGLSITLVEMLLTSADRFQKLEVLDMNPSLRPPGTVH